MLMIWFYLYFFAGIVFCDEHTHTYKDHEEVVLWMNTIGPYRNRQETYAFFDLPFCRGPKESIEHVHETLGEALQGVELQYSGIDIRFKDDVSKKDICTITPDQSAYDKLRSAIDNHYWYQMYLDDLPLWSIVGDISKENEAVIWTHKEFSISYNQNRIIKVVVMNSELKPLKPNTPISFTYSVKWQQSDEPFDRRYDNYLDFDFFKHRVHWFSIFNSFMMVIFLITLVFMILMRTLRRDYARYNKEDGLGDVDRELGDEYGWKQVHGDVFRTAVHPALLSSLVGSGAHLVAVTIIVLLLAVFNQLYTERGGFVSTGIFVFAATSPINGLVGGSLYAQMSGKHWIKQFLISASLLPTLVCSAAFVVNLIAVYYHVSRAIPFLTMVVVVVIVLFVIVPLNLVGTVLGRNLFGLSNYPCRVNSVPRPIPEKKWFMEPGFIVLVTGILPFGSIFIELYLILTSFWAYKIYFVYGFTVLVCGIVLVVTASVTTVGIYLLLNSEDYRWQWTSFLSGASVSIYAYAYAMYYFFFKTKMSGLFQTSFYFVYMALFCISLGIMCGSVGYLAAQKFVRKIYSVVKVD